MQYVLLVILIMLSAFFSASETAFSSINLIRLRQYAEEGRKGAKAALEIANRFDEVLMAILVGNNVVNLAAASIATLIAVNLLGESGVAVVTIVLTLILTLFGEIIPKSYARENAERFSLGVGSFYRVLLIILKPLILILIWIKGLIRRLYHKDEEEPSVTENELNVIIDTMEVEGVLEEEEVDMLQGVLDLSETFVKNIMTPRVDVIALAVTATAMEVKKVFLEEKYSRIPVYEDSRDNVIGVLYERDLLAAIIEKGALEAVEITELMRKVVYVSESMRVSSLLTRLQFEKQHLAIVVDEHGGTAGVVTLEDVLEEVVGEIYDEHDEEEQLLLKKSDRLYEARADIEIDALFDAIDVDLDIPEDTHSLGGWIYSKIEDIPKIGDTHQYHHLLFTVAEVEERRIKRVKIEIENPHISETE